MIRASRWVSYPPESGDVGVNPNAKQNSGKKSAGGKTEVVVTKLQATDMFAQAPTFLG